MRIATDTETTGLCPWNGDYPFAISVSDEQGNRALLKLDPALNPGVDALKAGLPAVWPKGVPLPGRLHWSCRSEIKGLKCLRDLRHMTEQAEEVIMYNAKFDMAMLESIGIDIPRSKVRDAMILVRLMFPNEFRVGLKNMAGTLLKVPYGSADAVKNYLKLHKIPDQFHKLPDNILWDYATDDAVYTMAIYLGLITKLPESMRDLWENESEIARIVVDMEQRGMRCDLEYADEQAKRCRELQAESLGRVEEVFGGEINLNSPKQLQVLLFDQLQLHETLSPDDKRRYHKILRTPKGLYSTKREALKVYDHPVIADIMAYRMFGKMAGTYFEKFIELADENSDIHPSFWQCGTRTGRFSGSDPSFQTIPSVSSGRLLDFNRDIIPDVRHCFGARPGYTLYAPDFSQIELRIAAWYASEEVMQQAFIDGRDIHDETTKAIFPHDWEDAEIPGKVDKPKRTFCKMVNFGVLYGMGIGKLSSDLGVPVDRARAFLDRYFNTYPGLKELMRKCQSEIVTRGYVESVFGRRFKADPQEAYKGLNYLIQGTAADVMKYTIVRMHDYFYAFDAHILNTVHDEVLFEINDDHDTVRFHEGLKIIMEYWPEFDPIPIPVNCKRAIDRWGNHEVVW